MALDAYLGEIEKEILIKALAWTDGVRKSAADLLGITSVHPMREEAVRTLLAKGGADWNLVERLLKAHALVEIEYRGQKHYLRRFPQADGRPAHPAGGQEPT